MSTKYQIDSHQKQCRIHMFTVTNITPAYGKGEREKTKRDIEDTLYRIFSKYTKKI